MGVNKWVDTGYKSMYNAERSPIISLADIKLWLTQIREKWAIGDHYNPNINITQNGVGNIIQVKIRKNNNDILFIGNEDTTLDEIIEQNPMPDYEITDDNNNSYTPNENDIALFFDKEYKSDHNNQPIMSEPLYNDNEVLVHAALYFDINRVYGDENGKYPGTDGYTRDLKWTHKTGIGKLIVANIARIDKIFDHSEENKIDMLKSGFGVVNNSSYGEVKYIITSR